MNKFDKKQYDVFFRKKELQEKRKAQFNTDLYYDEKKEIDEWLKKLNLSKADFIRTAKMLLERGCFEMKIENLYKINKLNKKATMLLNNNIDSKFYDFYFENEITWLIENEDKINQDYKNNINKLKFDIILNSDLDERIDLITSLKGATVEEFSNYINFIPFRILKKADCNAIEKKFEKFKAITNSYDLINYFDSICRKK